MPEQIKITARMVRQFNAKRSSLQDPCIICGADVLKCGHFDSGETILIFDRLKDMGKAGRDRILNEER